MEHDTVIGEPAREGREGALVGRVLGGRYHVFALVGAGGMGEVYTARDRELDEIVALKTLRPELAARAALVAQFRREVKLARRVAHPNVARVYELHDVDGARFVTMEYVEGEALSSLLQRKGKLPPSIAARLGAEVARALSAAHAAGVIHRDVKPDNLLLRADGHVVVTDFGIAFARDESSPEMSGTPAYMAPEQVRGEPAGPAVDLYALGVTLFELVTGTLPFEGETPIATIIARLSEPPPDPRTRARDLPDALAEALLRAMAQRPDERYADAASFAEALESLAAERLSLSPVPLEVHAPETPDDPAPAIGLRPIRGARDADAHLAVALREELLFALARVEGVRLELDDARAASASLTIEATVYGEGSRVALRASRLRDAETVFAGRFVLAPASIAELAALSARGVALAAGLETKVGDEMPKLAPGAVEPWIRARQIYRSVFSVDYGRSIALYEQALAFSPDHPVLLAGHAMASLRVAFFTGGTAPDLTRVRAEVERAMAGARGRPEPHLAAGHLELHTGDPVRAAVSFRTALRMAPAWPDGHEWLGRMLLEAGFVEDGCARLEAALLRSPELVALRWEIARARGLEGRWDEAERQLALLERAEGRVGARWLGLLRLASWKGDEAWIDRLARDIARVEPHLVFDAPLCHAVISALRGDWSSTREVFVARAFDDRFASRRRAVFYGQVASDLASKNGDVETALAALERAVRLGLFDLHWLEKSPHLELVRRDRRLAPLLDAVRTRATLIHDALHEA